MEKTFSVKSLILIVICIVILIVFQSSAFETKVYAYNKGPVYFLPFAKELMVKYFKKYGIYAKTFKELNNIDSNACRNLDVLAGNDYTYEIKILTIENFEIVTKNHKDLHNYIIDNKLKYPIWIFKSNDARVNYKKDLMNKFENSSVGQKYIIMWDFQHFPDKETKLYLLNIMKSFDNLQIQTRASTYLEGMIEEGDKYLIPDLISILQKPTSHIFVKYYIVKIFNTLEDVSTLPSLEKVIQEENDETPGFPIKSIAEQAIKNILNNIGRDVG